MSWTNFPNGVSLTTTTGTVSGHILGTTGSFSGLLTVGTVSGAQGVFSSVVGALFSLSVSFTTDSAAQTVCVGALPNFTCDLIGAFVTVNATSALVAPYTVQAGSAGTVHVSSENNTTGVDFSKSSLTIDTASVSTAAGLKAIRGNQGTAGDSYLTLLFKRTGM